MLLYTVQAHHQQLFTEMLDLKSKSQFLTVKFSLFYPEKMFKESYEK